MNPAISPTIIQAKTDIILPPLANYLEKVPDRVERCDGVTGRSCTPSTAVSATGEANDLE